MKHLITVLISSLFMTSMVLAKTVVFDSSEGRHFVEIYAQDGQWVVDEYLAAPRQWQERIAHRVFAHEYQALKFLNERQQGRKAAKNFPLVRDGQKGVAIWRVTNSWDEQWEVRYSQWVEQNLDKDFFTRHQLATDCADVAYALRWIFARNNGLPMGATLAGSQVLFTHESGKNEWARLATHQDWHKDLRFLTALNWLLNNVYTRTLWVDGYPLAINANSIRAGTINLLGGHTELVAKIINDGTTVPIQLLSSTVPRAVRELHGRVYTDSSAVEQSEGGLIQFRWLEKINTRWVLRAKEQMDDYSLEQYQEQLCEETASFALCVYQRMGMSFNPRSAVTSVIASLESTTRARIDIVRQGLQVCAVKDCSPGTMEWEDWSTPTRDKRLLESYVAAQNLVSEMSMIDEELPAIAERLFQAVTITEIGHGFKMKTFLERLQLSLVSSDPRDPWESRWASTIDGIASGVQNMVTRWQNARDILIGRASSCRQNPSSCAIGTTAFAELNTIELDAKTRQHIAGYGAFCEQEVCRGNAVPNKFDHVWQTSSLPWENENIRRGTSRTVKAAKVFYGAKTIEEMGDWLIVSSTELYDRKTMRKITTPTEAKLIFHRAGQQILAFKDNSIFKWNGQSFSIIFTTPLITDFSKFYVKSLGQNHLVVSGVEMFEEGGQVHIIDLVNMSVRGSYQSYNASWAMNESAAVSLMDNSSGAVVLIYEENGQLYTVASPVGTMLYGNLVGHYFGRWLWSAVSWENEDYNLALNEISQGAFVPYRSLGKVYSLTDFANLWLTQSDSELSVYDDQFHKIQSYSADWYNTTSSHGMNYIELSHGQNDKAVVIVKNGQLEEVSVPSNHSILGVHRNWVSLYENSASMIHTLDLSGRALLPASKTLGFKNCRGVSYELGCETKRTDLAVRLNVVQENNTPRWILNDVGALANLSVSAMSWVQIIQSSQPDSTSPIIDVGWGAGSSNKLENGTLVTPHSGVVMYYPAP